MCLIEEGAEVSDKSLTSAAVQGAEGDGPSVRISGASAALPFSKTPRASVPQLG